MVARQDHPWVCSQEQHLPHRGMTGCRRRGDVALGVASASPEELWSKGGGLYVPRSPASMVDR